jgi:phage/conjugal plasmid C-4 type zinc finger TraR family protein
MDDFDRAQELEMDSRNKAIAAQRLKQSNAPSRADCIDCGESIPLKRQALGGVTRCIDCQNGYENNKKRGLV